MKTTTLLFTSLLGFFFMTTAQTIVNTGTGNKHVILEEFTGIKCGNCPGGHTTIDNITASNPNTVHVIAYSPGNSSYTDPGTTGGADFRRSFGEAFYTSTYCSPSSGSRFMPSAFINRRLVSGDILTGTTSWTSETNTTLTEISPMNVGIKSTYNSNTQTLTIDVEVYYTASVTNNNSLYIMITEDNLTSTHQSGSNASPSNPYVYTHTFRENVSSGQWGDAITGATTQGSLYTTQYVFDLSTAIDPINISDAHIVAFVVDANSSNKEVYTGISASADGGQASTGGGSTGIENIDNTISVNSYPNPSNGNVTINIEGEKVNKFEIFNVLGKVIYVQNINSSNKQLVNLTENVFLSRGTYFVKVSGTNYSKTDHLIVN